MKKRVLYYLGLTTLLLSFASINLAATANSQSQFKSGQDYEIVKSTAILPENEAASGKVQVIEFFSYGCPWCYHLEPTVEKWLQTKPKHVIFDRVPVIYEPGWDIYAKAYYTAKSLDLLDKITPALFNAIHQQGQNLTSQEAMQAFFMKQGVSKADFNSIFNFSPGIGMELNQAKQLMLAYQVFEIPTFVIAGKYKTSIRMVNGDNEKLMRTINYLIQKATNEKK